MANPVLAEALRSGRVENKHRGSFCVTDSAGRVIVSAGDVESPVYPRSAVKSLQALALFASGAVEKFSLSDEEIALACASHLGEPRHVEIVVGLLEKLELGIDDLECGCHWPSGKAAAQALRAAGEEARAIHHNCSGKHAGMLAVARALGVDTAGYVSRDHEVQRLVRQQMELVFGRSFQADEVGTDGCSIPTYATPLQVVARGFARMATGERLTEDVAASAHRIFDAATGNAFLVRGTDSIDSEVMEAFDGALMLKVGAEGVFAGAVRSKGHGFALKIDDGNMDAAEVAMAEILLAISSPNTAEREVLTRRAAIPIKTWRKAEVGIVRGTDAARPDVS